MKYGFVLPGGTATEQIEQAVLAEQAGWDGVFVWEAAYGVEPWSLLAAMAMRTQRVRLGTMLTPLPWRRPWKVASQVATLDQISNGRAIISVGLGAPDPLLGNTGETTDRRTRAELLDEGIDIVRGLWTGDVKHAGKHYNVEIETGATFKDLKPVQARIPIWIVGAWPSERSMSRVLKGDGLLPNIIDREDPRRPITADEFRAMRAWLTDHGAPPDFDIVQEGETPADDAARARDQVAPWSDAGATWWIESRWQTFNEAEGRERLVQERIEAGPPRS